MGLRITGLPFGSSTSPFLLKASQLRQIVVTESSYQETATLLQKSLSVGDLNRGTAIPQETKNLRREATEVFGTAGMNLQAWAIALTSLKTTLNIRKK